MALCPRISITSVLYNLEQLKRTTKQSTHPYRALASHSMISNRHKYIPHRIVEATLQLETPPPTATSITTYIYSSKTDQLQYKSKEQVATD